MPKLSLYRPEKSQDYKFIDRTVYEMFSVGGVDVHVHKYIGPVDPSDPGKALGETTIQDVVFLENRDRKYDSDVYTLRGVFNVQDIDFNLSQFGLFLQNDTVFMTVHINNSVDLIGRKIMPGDVFELPNLKDEYALNDFKSALKRYYVVEDVNRAAEGFSATWYPHLYRIKLKPIMDSQEFKDILDRPEDEDSYAGDYDNLKVYYPGQVVKYYGKLYQVLPSAGSQGTSTEPTNTDFWQEYSENSLRDVLSTYNKEMQLNSALLAEAESDAPLSGYDTSHFYTLAVDKDTGEAAVTSVDTVNDTVSQTYDISQVSQTPVRDGYQGYLLGDGIAPNGPLTGTDAQFGFGLQFPRAPFTGDMFLRTDYLPNRLFRWDGRRWNKMEDKVRMELSNTDTRQTLKTSFINNTELSGIRKKAGDVVVLDAARNHPVDPNGITDRISVIDNIVTIYTKFDYADYYKIEAWVNEDGFPKITTFNELGKLAFRMQQPILDGSRIRFTIFDHTVEQRQGLSKALRRLKPEADN